MARTLVIVESPTKAKTIAKFLGSDFKVESSMGHVRDLPKSVMSVDIEGGTFAPNYEIPSSKKKTVARLRKLAQSADEILLATDEDREGEAISWHLAKLLRLQPTAVKRLVFHEITKPAITAALKQPRPLDQNLVDAQQARRVLDRLVGYKLSPLLWKKVRYGLSAGRVQSVAVHLIVDRENERKKFKSAAYYDLLAELNSDGSTFLARLIAYGDKPLPAGKDFDEANGQLKQPDNFFLLNQPLAQALAEKLRPIEIWTVTNVTETPYQTHPYPPFITSTLQQEASRKLGWGAKQAMRVAQSLYENGYITYMRTDSVNLSAQAVHAAREAAREFGVEYVADAPRQYTNKSKLAQEAHEAVRPAGDSFRHPSHVRQETKPDEARLYDLIWKRTVASQMKSAQLVRLSITVAVEQARFEAKGKRIAFAGYLRAYVEGADDPAQELEDKEVSLPKLKEKQTVKPKSVRIERHETQPPARYTEASLIKKLETEGVGRPSTYATILDTIMARDYVNKTDKVLVPTFTAMIVDEYLQTNFGNLVDVNFTSRMEDDLDLVATGQTQWQPYIKNFYYGNNQTGFNSEIDRAAKGKEYPILPIGTDPQTHDRLVIKSGKYGPYLQRGDGGKDNTCSLPDAISPAELNPTLAVQILQDKASGPSVMATDPATGQSIIYCTGRFGPYLQIGEDGARGAENNPAQKIKRVALTYGPKRTPISRSIDIHNLAADDALKIIALPRTLGKSRGETITAMVGRFGPYLKKGQASRSLPKDKDILTLTLQEAESIMDAAPAKRRAGGAAVLKELGADPETGRAVQVLDGRYGPYVSNGTRIFVSVPEAIKPADVTLEQAQEWLKKKKEKKTKRKTRRSG